MELKIQGAFATTNTSEPTLNGKQADPRQEQSHSRRPIERVCLCGSPHHKPRTCFYIDERKRPEGWKPHHETLRTVNEKIDKGSARLKQMVERIRKATYNPDENNSMEKSKEKATNQENNTMQSSANFTAFSSDEEDQFESVSAMALHPKDLGLTNALNAQLALSNEPLKSPLRDSVICDPGSHVHVGNNRDRFESIEPHHEELLIGDHRTIIEGYGMMHVKLTKANGSTKILRAHAAYIPGFHTNIISTNLTEERIDVCFDQRSRELQKGPERECFAKLQKIHGLFVIEYNPINHSFATGSNFPSTTLTERTTQSAGEEDRPEQKNNVAKFPIQKSQGIQQLLIPELTMPASSSPTPVSTLSEDIPPDLPEEELDGELSKIRRLFQGFMDDINTVNPPAIRPTPIVPAQVGETITVSANVNVLSPPPQNWKELMTHPKARRRLLCWITGYIHDQILNFLSERSQPLNWDIRHYN